VAGTRADSRAGAERICGLVVDSLFFMVLRRHRGRATCRSSSTPGWSHAASTCTGSKVSKLSFSIPICVCLVAWYLTFGVPSSQGEAKRGRQLQEGRVRTLPVSFLHLKVHAFTVSITQRGLLCNYQGRPRAAREAVWKLGGCDRRAGHVLYVSPFVSFSCHTELAVSQSPHIGV
jgi:hypothetical protein